MRRIALISILFLFLLPLGGKAQYYWVFFTDKRDVAFDPYEYFDLKAIERRVNHGLPLCDSTDFPLNALYKQRVAELADTIAGETRWLNGVFVHTDLVRAEQIKLLPFVREVIPATGEFNYTSNDDYPVDSLVNEYQEKLLRRQTERLGGTDFKKAGLDGHGIRIAILDAGFPSVDTLDAFQHIREEGRIIKTWDFVKNRENVYAFNSHGTMVMSCVGGMLGDLSIGLATGAEFLLARTEVGTEPYSEEKNWLQAMEWADKNGAYIINSSLGYTYHRYFNNEMDGKHSLVARAALMAARKGILVVNAAGNEGDKVWKYVGTPADADSILSIGGIDPTSGYHISFSSFGPTSDGRLKPNVCAFGSAVVASPSGITVSYGTSFASPLIAGFAACAWQSRPAVSNSEMYDLIQKSGDLYPYYDYAHGYGVPRASFFTSQPRAAVKSFDFVKEENNLKIIIADTSFLNVPDTNESYNLLYYKIESDNGGILHYAVISVREKEAYVFDLGELEKGKHLVVHFRGYTNQIIIE